MSKPWKEHWKIVKGVFMYLHDTTDYTIYYQGRPRLARVLDVHGFIDADWVGDMDHKISASGYVFNIFVREICWMRKRHIVVSFSTTDVESMATTHASR
jgi:hypothetical protein